MQSFPSLNSPYTYFYQILNDPLVFVVSSGILFNSGVTLALHIAQNKECHIIVQPSWNIHSQINVIASDICRSKIKNPFANFVILCPTIDEYKLAIQYGLEALFVHKNAFIDEKIFSPNLEVKKEYSAVHIANVEKFKRHHLAWDLNNIAVITYSYLPNPDLKNLEGYRNISYANFFSQDGVMKLKAPLRPKEVNEIIRASQCGLILSEEEGTNNASTEYLLSGIPFISTPSKGGRSEFYDDKFVFVVNPEAYQIQLAVDKLQNISMDPYEIRESILEKIRPHRIRFLNWLCEKSQLNLYSIADENYWIPQFVNKLRLTLAL